MIIEINVPNIGGDELEVTEIMIKIGDNIHAHQTLITIESDKSSIEIPTPYPGIVSKICTKIGEKVRTGSLIVLLDTKHTNTPPPILNEQKKILQKNTNLTNIITKKIKNENLEKKELKNNTHSFSNIMVHATPLIRHMAREFSIDLSKIKGSGRKGRITKEDIQDYIHTQKTQYLNYTTTSEPDINPISQLKTNTDKSNNINTVQLNKIQKITGKNLQKNWINIPHVTQFNEADITDLEIFRKKQNLIIEKKKINYKITPLVFVIKAVAKALEKLPKFNSSLSQDGQNLILKKNINIGIAVNTKKGLLVPILRDANKKSILELSKELITISKKARSENTLTPYDLKDGSFTISSLGNIGGMNFTPIINAPEVAILGVSKAFMKPIWNGKKFTPRLMLPLSLSYDHRVINGADGAQFIILISEIISDIRLLSM